MANLSEQQWQAIQRSDQTADGTFWYGVSTTHIFCRPSCVSRIPKRKNVRIFSSPKEALAAGFRPCKRCQPTQQPIAIQQIAAINQYLEQHLAEPLSAGQIATANHLSESQLRHLFQQQTGQTPLQALQQLRLSTAARLLQETTLSLETIADQVGMPNLSYFITKFKQANQITPKQFRLKQRVCGEDTD